MKFPQLPSCLEKIVQCFGGFLVTGVVFLLCVFSFNSVDFGNDTSFHRLAVFSAEHLPLHHNRANDFIIPNIFIGESLEEEKKKKFQFFYSLVFFSFGAVLYKAPSIIDRALPLCPSTKGNSLLSQKISLII